MEQFIVHGKYVISNCGGYEIQFSQCNEMARVRDAYGSKNPQTSKWLPIGLVHDADIEDWIPVIDPKGYHIPLDLVIRTS